MLFLDHEGILHPTPFLTLPKLANPPYLKFQKARILTVQSFHLETEAVDNGSWEDPSPRTRTGTKWSCSHRDKNSDLIICAVSRSQLVVTCKLMSCFCGGTGATEIEVCKVKVLGNVAYTSANRGRGGSPR